MNRAQQKKEIHEEQANNEAAIAIKAQEESATEKIRAAHNKKMERIEAFIALQEAQFNAFERKLEAHIYELKKAYSEFTA